MELDLKKKTLLIKFDGREHNIRFPTVHDMKRISEMESNTDETNAVERLAEQFEILGLPKDVFMQLEMDHIEAIKDAIMPKKK